MPTFPLGQFLLINKPIGWTSFDAVAFVRRQVRQAHPDQKVKVGHAGTLDPFASGLLIIGVGREATRKIDDFKKLPKIYLAKIRLGATTDTFDSTGQITPNPAAVPPSLEQIQQAISGFIGPQEQIPPMFSAKKIAGKRLYELARQGQEVERKPAKITIYDIKLLEYNWPYISIEVHCGAGTYIRTLAHDLGQKLDTGAYCEELTRTAIGDYRLENAQNIA